MRKYFLGIALALTLLSGVAHGEWPYPFNKFENWKYVTVDAYVHSFQRPLETGWAPLSSWADHTYTLLRPHEDIPYYYQLPWQVGVQMQGMWPSNFGGVKGGVQTKCWDYGYDMWGNRRWMHLDVGGIGCTGKVLAITNTSYCPAIWGLTAVCHQITNRTMEHLFYTDRNLLCSEGTRGYSTSFTWFEHYGRNWESCKLAIRNVIAATCTVNVPPFCSNYYPYSANSATGAASGYCDVQDVPQIPYPPDCGPNSSYVEIGDTIANEQPDGVFRAPLKLYRLVTPINISKYSIKISDGTGILYSVEEQKWPTSIESAHWTEGMKHIEIQAFNLCGEPLPKVSKDFYYQEICAGGYFTFVSTVPQRGNPIDLREGSGYELVRATGLVYWIGDKDPVVRITDAVTGQFLFEGDSSVYRHGIDTTGWTDGLKNIEATGYDAVCQDKVVKGYGSFNFYMGVEIKPSKGLYTTEAGGIATFIVALKQRPTADVVINFSSSDETEGLAAPSNLTFNSSNWNSPQTVVVYGVDDGEGDCDQPYKILTGRVFSQDSYYKDLSVTDIQVINGDNEVCASNIVVSKALGDIKTYEAGGSTNFQVYLLQKPTGNVVINLSVTDSAEGRLSTDKLIFAPNNFSVAQTVTVTGVDDSIADCDKQYWVVISPAESTDPAYHGVNAPDLLAYNMDNEECPYKITVFPTELAVSENGDLDYFWVKLIKRPQSYVNIDMHSSLTTEVKLSPARVMFTTTNWDKPQKVTVTGIDDMVIDGDKTVSIVTHAATSIHSYYNGFNPPDVIVTNLDNDDCTRTGMVKILGKAKFYPDLPSAYYTASEGDLLLLGDGTFPSMTFNHDKRVLLEGGADCRYEYVTGITNIQNLTIEDGEVVIVDGIVIGK